MRPRKPGKYVLTARFSQVKKGTLRHIAGVPDLKRKEGAYYSRHLSGELSSPDHMLWERHTDNRKKDVVIAEETNQAAETKSPGCGNKATTCYGRQNTLNTFSPEVKRGNINFSQLLSTEHLANILQTIAITFSLTINH